MGRTECTRRLERHRTSAKCAVRCVGNEGWKGSVWNLRLGLGMGKGKEKKGFAYSIAPSDASVLGRAVSSTSLNKSRMSTSVVPENLLSHPSGVAIISMENFCFLTFFWRGGKKTQHNDARQRGSARWSNECYRGSVRSTMNGTMLCGQRRVGGG